MIKQMEQLCIDADSRYANDAELQFLEEYLKTARLRFNLYQKIQKLEPSLIQRGLMQIQAQDPNFLKMGNTDLTAKWQRDTVRVIRYGAAALLSDDPDLFKERMLLWFATIMQSFQVEQSCEVTYQAMQAIFREALTPVEAALFCPFLEMSRQTLGTPKA
jgi:hypothetical protein